MTTADARPMVVAYDGSAEVQIALRQAAALFPGDAVPVADEANVAETVARIAEQRDACAVVAGSRGLGGFKRHLLGSTTQRLLRDGHRPVLVVRAQ